MPIYEFECDSCDQPFEELVFGSAIDKVTCPKCGGDDIHKLVSTFASRIAGGGAASLSASSAASCNTGGL